MQMFTLKFYEKANGRCPVLEFLETLDNETKAKVFYLFNLLEEKGNTLREPYSKPIGNGLFEIRYQGKDQPTRVLYFFYIGYQIVLTNGFIKKTKKTPKREIKQALKYMKDYISREGDK